ncbi:MAG: beta-lactamase family protein [Chthonomonadales bacterium]|nr:beta-lactamase family protein [Chthonomonadales bacterium]
MAAGDEPAARVASRGKSPFSLSGMEGDTRLGADGQCPDGDVLRQEQINGILVTRVGPGIPELDQLYTRMMALTNVPGAAFVLCYKGRLVYAAGFGYSNLEDKIPFTPYTLCEIGSVSKVVACTSMLTAVEEGRIRLDTKLVPVLEEQLAKRGYPPVPQRNPALDAITLKDAMNHSDGYFWDGAQADKIGQTLGIPAESVTDIDVCRYLLRFPPRFTPGTKSEYGSHGLQLALAVCAMEENTDPETYIKNRLSRLGIFDAYCNGSHRGADYNPEATPSYNYDGNTGSFSKGAAYRGMWKDEGSAVGSWVMSPVSLARFGDRFLDVYRDPARMSDLIINNRSDKNGGYALGWMSTKLPDGDGWYLGHGGSIGGWRTALTSGWNGFTIVGIFNSEDRRNNVLGHALYNPVPDSMFDEYNVPRETIPPSCRDLLRKLSTRIQRGGFSRDLWTAAGYPN